MIRKEAFISPVPPVWNEIYQLLVRYWENDLESVGDMPPKPLILAGWSYSSDLHKAERWRSTIKWAEARGCVHLIRALKEEEKYYA